MKLDDIPNNEEIDLSDIPDGSLDMSVPFNLDGIIEQESKSLPIEKNVKKDISDIIYPLARPFLATGIATAKAVNAGLAAFSTHLDVISEYIEDKTGLKSSGIFENAAKVYEENVEYWQRKADRVGVGFVDELLGEAIGGAPAGIAEFVLNMPYSAILGAAEAEEGEEISGALVGAAKRGVLGVLFKTMAPLKQYLRAPLMGTVFGIQSASEGGDIKEVAKSFGTGAIYSLSSPGGQLGLNELKKNIVSNIVFKENKAKTVEKYKPKVEIPVFKNTQEALAFGEKMTPEQYNRLKELRIESKKKSEGLRVVEDFNEAIKEATRGQLFREAMEAYDQKADIVVTPIEPTKRVGPLFTEEQIKRRSKKKEDKIKQLNIESAEQQKEQVHAMIRDRRANIDLAAYETNLFINDIEKQTTKKEREVIPFIIEGTEVPKGLKRPDLENIKDIEKLGSIAEQVKEHFNKGWQKVKENTPDMSADQIENYVTHIWDIPKAKKQEVTNWFTTQNRFMKKRYIETLNEGIEKFGLTPKVLDIGDIIRIHDSVTNKVIENNKFVERLKELKVDGVSLVERADLAPPDWIYFNHPALRKGMVIPSDIKMGEKISPDLANLLTEMGVAIGRRISPKIFGKPNLKAGEYRAGKIPEIRLQRFFEDRTVAHEIGHHLDMTLKLGKEFLDNFKTELYEINKERIKSLSTKKPGYAESAEEQIAEFFAVLFTKPEKAYNIAPNATAEVLGKLKQDGTLSKLIDFNFEKNSKNLIEEQLNTLVKLPVMVHPDLAKPLKVVFDSRAQGPILNAYEMINGVLKKTNLSISLFHHGALGETGIATMGLMKTGKIYLDPVKIYKALVKKEYEAFKKEDIARDAIKHGLQLGATADIPVAMIQRKLNEFANKTNNIPVINKATEFIRTFNETWDRALWDYLHDTLKLYAYESLSGKLDINKDLSKQKQEVSQFVNDTFGGQNWDSLMISPKTVQQMSWFLLSPDWTVSTVRQALSPTGFGAIHKETAKLRKQLGGKFWLKAGLYFGVGINMLNYAFRKWDEKEHPEYYKDLDLSFMDRTMFGNTIGHKTHLFVGRYEDGTERYVRWGKQFRELPEMFFDDTGFSPISASIKKVGGKMAPVLQLTAQITTGSSLSGFKNDDISGKEGWDKVLGMGKTLMTAPLPFSARTLFQDDKEFHITDIMMPSSKGMTRYKSMELFKHAINKKDEQLLKETYQFTLLNNLPAYTLFNAAITSLKAEATREYNDNLKTFDDVINQLPEAENIVELNRLQRILKRLQKEQLDKEIGIDLLDKAILDMKIYDLKK